MTEKKKEPKTVFGHMADIFGVEKKEDKKSLFSIVEIKKLIISFILFLALGYVIGTIIDIFLETDKFGPVLALFFVIIWIIKKGKSYFSD